MAENRLIYVVDDDEAVRDSLTLLLESAGHEVEAFEAAGEALASCSARRPSCVITDIRMPEMDGLEFQEQLVSSRIEVPVIVITGHADVPLAVRTMKAGAVDFIEKPFSDDVILASIETALAKAWKDIDPELNARLDTLTPREREVLELLVVGHPNKIIAGYQSPDGRDPSGAGHGQDAVHQPAGAGPGCHAGGCHAAGVKH